MPSFRNTASSFSTALVSVPTRSAPGLVTETQRDVTGVVRLKLYKGNIIVAGRKSPKSLYDPKIATMEGDMSVRQRTDSPWRAYDQSDATGVIRLNGLRLKLRALPYEIGALGSGRRGDLAKPSRVRELFPVSCFLDCEVTRVPQSPRASRQDIEEISIFS